MAAYALTRSIAFLAESTVKTIVARSPGTSLVNTASMSPPASSTMSQQARDINGGGISGRGRRTMTRFWFTVNGGGALTGSYQGQHGWTESIFPARLHRERLALTVRPVHHNAVWPAIADSQDESGGRRTNHGGTSRAVRRQGPRWHSHHEAPSISWKSKKTTAKILEILVNQIFLGFDLD